MKITRGGSRYVCVCMYEGVQTYMGRVCMYEYMCVAQALIQPRAGGAGCECV